MLTANGSQTNIIVLGTAAVAAIAFGGLYYYLTNSQPCDDNLLPALELELTQKIMTKILDQLKFVALQHSRIGEQICRQLEQQGQNMSEIEVRKHFILPHFENAFESAQQEILDEFDVEEDELEEAALYYSSRGDAKLKEIISKIQLMHKQFGGENAGTQSSTSTTSETSNAVVSSQELSLGQVINLLQSLSEKVNEATDSFIEEFKETYGMPSRSNIMQFQQGMMQMSESMEAAVLESAGVTAEVFQKSLLAHQHNQLLQQTVMTMQMENQQRLAQHGIQLSM